MHTGSDLEYLHAYRLVLKISAETGAKGRERKNQWKKKLNNKKNHFIYNNYNRRCRFTIST